MSRTVMELDVVHDFRTARGDMVRFTQEGSRTSPIDVSFFRLLSAGTPMADLFRPGTRYRVTVEELEPAKTREQRYQDAIAAWGDHVRENYEAGEYDYLLETKPCPAG